MKKYFTDPWPATTNLYTVFWLFNTLVRVFLDDENHTFKGWICRPQNNTPPKRNHQFKGAHSLEDPSSLAGRNMRILENALQKIIVFLYSYI